MLVWKKRRWYLLSRLSKTKNNVACLLKHGSDQGWKWKILVSTRDLNPGPVDGQPTPLSLCIVATGSSCFMVKLVIIFSLKLAQVLRELLVTFTRSEVVGWRGGTYTWELDVDVKCLATWRRKRQSLSHYQVVTHSPDNLVTLLSSSSRHVYFLIRYKLPDRPSDTAWESLTLRLAGRLLL